MLLFASAFVICDTLFMMETSEFYLLTHLHSYPTLPFLLAHLLTSPFTNIPYAYSPMKLQSLEYPTTLEQA